MTADLVVDVELTSEQARSLTDEIRQTLRVGHDLIIRAFSGRAWSALGYDSWDAYCAGEFTESRMVRLDRSQRREIATEMHDAGMSNRAISSGLGVAPATIDRDLSGATNEAPEPVKVTGSDGKAYPWSPKPEPVEDEPTVVDTTTGEISPAPSVKASNRRPLTDAFYDAVTDLGRISDRIVRLSEDDRFTRNANQIATSYRSDLVRALDAMHGVVSRLS